MIGTAQELASRLREASAAFDVCIVGAGPAGISLALDLDGSGLRVCLLEAGGEHYDRASQRLYEGEFQGDRYPPLRDTRLGALGGTSHVWAGWCRPLDAGDFQPRRRAGAHGWPFDRDALTPHYRRAQERCGLGIFEYDSAYWQTQLRRPLLLEDDDAIEHAIFHVLPQRFGQRFRAALEASANIEVALNAPVARLQIAESGAVNGVLVQTLDGTTSCVTARRYVLAAGGIENARLLLLSADSPERALGNEHGLLGRYFTDHPFVNVGTLVLNGPPRGLDFYFPQPLAPSAVKHVNGAGPPAVRAALTLKREILATENIGNSALFFHPQYEAHPAFASAEVKAFLELVDKLRHKAVPGGLAPYFGRAIRAPHRVAFAAARKLLVRDAPARRWRMRAMFETESQYSNRVTLGRERDALNRPRARVEWRLSEYDFQSMRRAMRLYDASFRRAGLGRLELGIPDTAEGWRNAVEGGKHHIGTTRMHVDPQHGVVDAQGKVHGSPNLYVTGSSVFPSGGYANPTLTIVALALRLADHLRHNFTPE